MKKTHVGESIRSEAERLDRLEKEGALDDLPFTTLRRYAKEPSQVYAIRIPVTRLETIKRLATVRGEQPTSLIREWVLERLDEELSAARQPSTASRRAGPSRVRKGSVAKSKKAAAGSGKRSGTVRSRAK